MNKTKKQYVCNSCGSVTTKWTGQCFDCRAWNTLEEDTNNSDNAVFNALGVNQTLYTLNTETQCPERILTNIVEFDRVLGGGLVLASAILIGGDPGIGKSTLLLQLSAAIASDKNICIYITGEESAEQIRLRATRLGIINDFIYIVAASKTEDIIATIDVHKKHTSFIVIDSIQTICSGQLSSAIGTVAQIRYCAQQLIAYTKQHNFSILFTCHVTKDGQLAGPKLLEHMVDTVLYFEGDHNNHYRILRSTKNRFGSVNEIGIFDMTSQGLQEIPDPSALFLIDRQHNINGSAVFAGIEGSRAILVEIQALIAISHMPTPRRSVVGWDPNRLSMMIAVLAVRFGLNLSSSEVYLSVAGGIKISDPAADLAVAAALISAATNISISPKMLFFGEVGLAGEVRNVSRCDLRIKEALKMGFNKIVCAKSDVANDPKLVQTITHLKQLQSLLCD